MLRFALLLLVPGFAFAQSPPAKPPQGKLEAAGLSRGDEHRVFAQLVEFLHRDTFPPSDVRESDRVPKSSTGVKTFVETRRQFATSVRTRLREMKADPELIAAYDAYLDVLAKADDYGNKARSAEDAYMKGVQTIRNELRLDAATAQLRAGATLARSNAYAAAWTLGGWNWTRSYSRIRSAGITGNLIAGLNLTAVRLDLLGDLLQLQKIYNRRMARYEAYNLPRMKQQLLDAEDRFVADLAASRSTAVAQGAKDAAALSTRYGWAKGEVTFDPFNQPVTPGTSANPFAPLAKLNAVTKIRTAKDADECEALAERLLTLVEKLPPGEIKGTGKVYAQIRANMAFLALQHANKAAQAQLGGDDLAACQTVPTSAGKVGMRAVKLYHEASVGMEERAAPKAVEKQQEAFAYAYSGQLTRAFNVAKDVLPRDLAGVNDPDYYLEHARLLCLGKTDGVLMAMKYLSGGFLAGSREPERVRIAPDFAVLRKTNPQIVEKIIALYKE